MSTANTVSLPPSSGTQANLRAWASGLKAQILAAGWGQTSDTGQTAAASLTVPAGTGSQFEIFHMSDTLQGTNPMMLKLGYGELSSGDGRPAIWISIGQGTDGAGNLTGNTTGPFGICSQSQSSTSYNCYFSGDTNRFGIALWSDPLLNSPMQDPIIFVIERTKNASGADTGEGIIILANSTYNTGLGYTSRSVVASTLSTVLPLGAFGVPTPYGQWLTPSSPAGSLANGANVGVLFITPIGYQPYGPGFAALVYQGTDFSPLTTQSIPGIYGSSHTYLPLGQTSDVGNSSVPNSIVPMHCHVMIRFE